MSKELEALERIKREAGIPYFSSLYDIDMQKEDFETIETALKRLENYEKNEDFYKDVLNYAYLSEQDKIKKLKAFEIIKEKCLKIDFKILLASPDYETYCFMANSTNYISKKEFDLLKEVLEK